MRQWSGQRAWLLQRISALVLLAAVLAGGCWLLLGGARPGWPSWRAFAAHPAGASVLLLVVGALAVHAWVGVRDVLLDYVHRPGLRLSLLALLGTGLVLVWVRTLLVLAVPMWR